MPFYVRVRWVSLGMLWLAMPCLWGQQPAGLEPPRDSQGRQSIFDAMSEDMDGLLEIRLTTDLGQLIKKRTAEEYQPAHIQFVCPSGQVVDGPLEVKARGKTRKEICSHPPIKVKWKKKALDSLGFSRFNEMKVVWQCKPGRLYEQTLLKEYMVYRMNNLVTPYSYRVKLARITLTDARDSSRQFVKYGFFLEDDEQLALRLNGKLVDEPVKTAGRFSREEMLRFFVFQYMVSNTDWSFGNLHNVRVLQLETGRTIPIGYDYDYSGVVAAIYAVPHESLPIKSVRERYYKGIDCKGSEIQELNDFFLTKKEAIMAYCEQFPLLDNADRKDVVHYMGAFFDMLESRTGLKQVINELKQ